MGFPKSVCTSVNDVLCHGIPDNRPLEEGDFINIDVTCYLDGHHGDNSAMVTIGEPHPEVADLIYNTRYAMNMAIKECGPQVPYSRIGDVINHTAI